MKSMWREIILSVMMGMILPNILLNWKIEREDPEPPIQPNQLQTEPPRNQTQPPAVSKVSMSVSVRMEDGNVETMDMDAYLLGVVLAEMPADFEKEAKKAQAVVARTYARKAWVTGGKHGDGSVCTDSGCCQAYLAVESYLALGGKESAVDAAREAAEETSGYVLTYEGELIEATYFSCSGGSTEDAVAVWGTDFPYLRATVSPGEERATHYTDTVEFTAEEFARALNLSGSGSPDTWIGSATYTAGGGIYTMYIDGTEFTGTQLRSLLGLRSTAFTITTDGERVIIVTRGFGHRVGMSQYGADAMAASGSTWKEILAYYYKGTTLELTNEPG